MAQCCIGAYYAIVPYHLVLLCSCTYILVMQIMILRISTLQFGSQYIWICTVICAVLGQARPDEPGRLVLGIRRIQTGDV